MAKWISNVTTLAGFGSRGRFQLTKGEPVEGLTDEEYAMLGDNVIRVVDDDPAPAPEPEPTPEPVPEPEPAPEPEPEEAPAEEPEPEA